ncbi:MAG: NADH-quinone oxidoreductase subunit NuoE [Gammaproteobacteria bacterium]
MQTESSSLISDAARQEIDRWLKKFPSDRKRSAVLIALRLVQEQNGGWLTTELMDAVADYLDLSPIAVYEVASFYSMFHVEPVGKYRLDVCNNISCMLRGSQQIIAHLEQRLGIEAGETTADGLFTLHETECLAACVDAPMLQVNYQTYHEKLTPEKVDNLLAEIRQLESQHAK